MSPSKRLLQILLLPLAMACLASAQQAQPPLGGWSGRRVPPISR
jgi:hypothetical protein